ncbi:MAG TPA: hypothetical protein VKA67_01245, partial [Verrucomicrobiae bacterium]|nr:hypothetical protein [Verrucomicrobiae bacterium]
MRKAALLPIVLIFILSASTAWAWEPNPQNKMELKVQGAILDLLSKDPGMKDWFKNAAGYAVFPSVGKGGIGIGGAYGKGLVIAGD